ncbi:BREX-1 system adenine-specific DNA-methyltransferase PglX [Hoeflea sp. YIM 152468]|uniref:BREX-1 system adenine-specific DNA-methyltransferase PglX n=1 Tax=Hoeflea sp. YIM 152468 TaxID=3031759 RepID=UPI0023DB84C7|nr:BREX-1 system adenine-specific DNA-methyltransferase PglX [Hoeflea sp. YIM 152468]MDF1607715.1 BREX-1 system adenine-specific DNA-methyltransferase PglX [Hoeflea sp. YIM 152468]
MDTGALKKFAQSARNLLIDQVAAKLDLVLDQASAARREHPKAVRELENAIRSSDRKQVVEQVAYTWFNRFTALRFMDACGYTNPRVVSPADGQTRPEILSEAMSGSVPDGASPQIAALLNGRSPSNDPQAEAYRLLLVHVCNQWHGPMPFMFEEIDDYTELLMPEDLLSQTSILAELRKVMTEDACQDVEIIGWLYQFYISEKKDQVFAGLKKNQKITAENIPAATQLFTPHWIVRYLVENSLGRLWLLNRPQSKLAERMDYYIAPEEPETDFLKITKPEEIRICDPAAGSGHMLTYAFDLLYAIYEEEGYEATEIPALILTHNLTGIEIDDRAGALAAFALTMKAAAKLGRRRFLRMEAKPNICVLQNVAFTEAEMQDVAAVVGRDMFTDELRETCAQFEQAKNFGSLIVPKLRDPAETLRVVEARDFGGDLLLKEVQARVMSVLRMAEALSPKYHVVVANPPYMGSGGMNDRLNAFGREQFCDSRSDLFAMFMERSLMLSRASGIIAMINMQSWMFLSSFEKLRTKLLSNCSILNMAHLGERGFDSIGGAVVSTTAFSILNSRKHQHVGEYLRLVDGQSETEKARLFFEAKKGEISENLFRVQDELFKLVPGQAIAYWLSPEILKLFNNEKLGEKFDAKEGVGTRNDEVFMRLQWEVSRSNVGRHARWIQSDKAGDARRWYMGFNFLMDWEDDGFSIKNYRNEDGSLRSRPQNTQFLFRSGVTWAKVSAGAHAFRWRPEGYGFNDAAPTLFGEEAFYVLGQLNSVVMKPLLAATGNTINISTGTLGSLPILDQSFLDELLQRNSKNLVNCARSDWDAYETSWDFTTLPLLSPAHRAGTLEATYARLRAHWQGMTDEMQRLEEENNRIFIDAYGLQDELTPEVPIEEITLTCNPAYRYGVKGSEADREARLRADTMAEFLSYAVGCMFGRYSLDASGLILANQGETLEDYLARIQVGDSGPTFMPDEDNVIPVLDGDWFPDDITDRFRLFLATTFGAEKLQENLRFIEEALGKDVRKYFTRDFYNDHVRRYKKRPIYWMFSSPKGSFNALIYMHRYRPDTVSVVLNDYLREFITKLETERARLEQLADDASASQSQRTKALKDVTGIIKQIDELTEWEREVLFPLAQKQLEIDLDDGVKANYPLFGDALKPIKGLEAKDE